MKSNTNLTYATQHAALLQGQKVFVHYSQKVDSLKYQCKLNNML